MSIITNAKEIADLIKKLGNVDLYRKIVELEGEIIELTQTECVLLKLGMVILARSNLSSDICVEQCPKALKRLWQRSTL